MWLIRLVVRVKGGEVLTMEDMNVSNSFLLVEVTPTAANIVGWKTFIVRQFLVQQA
jgi:hypothetical protein